MYTYILKYTRMPCFCMYMCAYVKKRERGRGMSKWHSLFLARAHTHTYKIVFLFIYVYIHGNTSLHLLSFSLSLQPSLPRSFQLVFDAAFMYERAQVCERVCIRCSIIAIYFTHFCQRLRNLFSHLIPNIVFQKFCEYVDDLYSTWKQI